MQIIYPTTAANLFHAYRRQLRRDYRKPLINMVSKKLLKLKDSLAKLIAPTKDKNQPQFRVFISVPDEQEEDKNFDKYYKKVLLFSIFFAFLKVTLI